MTGPASCLVVVPMKDPSRSKTRLSEALAPVARQRLSRLLYRRTLAVLQDAQKCWPHFDIAVVTAAQDATDIAAQHKTAVIPEGAPSSLSLAIDRAADWSMAQGYKSMAVFPADLAAPDPAEICQFLKLGMETQQPVLCPSTDMGTNAIMLSLPTVIAFAYGKNSAYRHREALESAGLTPILLPLESLRFDIDTSACLEQAARNCPDIAALKASSA